MIHRIHLQSVVANDTSIVTTVYNMFVESMINEHCDHCEPHRVRALLLIVEDMVNVNPDGTSFRLGWTQMCFLSSPTLLFPSQVSPSSVSLSSPPSSLGESIKSIRGTVVINHHQIIIIMSSFTLIISVIISWWEYTYEELLLCTGCPKKNVT